MKHVSKEEWIERAQKYRRLLDECGGNNRQASASMSITHSEGIHLRRIAALAAWIEDHPSASYDEIASVTGGCGSSVRRVMRVFGLRNPARGRGGVGKLPHERLPAGCPRGREVWPYDTLPEATDDDYREIAEQWPHVARNSSAISGFTSW